MADVLAPRGPDGAGLHLAGRAALAQRRLKIFDLSERGAQPMVDSALGLSAVYNGAVYNYRELRDELKRRGYHFFSDSDTEVVLKAYHAWGEGFVERLNGMFALGIVERDTGRVLLARDRLGIKPLYYAEHPTSFRFASSAPALVAGGDVNADIDPVALHHYLTFHAVVPAPRTILEGVRKLPPATVLVLEADGTRRSHTYWTPSFQPSDEDQARSFEEWQELVLEVLRRSVRRRLVADVEVGVLLSGGLDSSLVVGLLATEGAAGIKTFSVGFEDVGGEAGNEFRYSDVIADCFRTDHRRIVVESDRLLGALPHCIHAMAEPMVSHDAIGFYLLAEEVAKHVKVVQSGQGADELFAGYHWYPPLLDVAGQGVDEYARVFFDREDAEIREAVHPRLHLGEDASRTFVAEHFRRPGACTAVDRALRLDATVMLVDDPVKRVDNMTMAWGLEARVPFLDHEVVELTGRIPAGHKVRNGGKHVLKEAARRVIPQAVIDRPKGYFPVPALKHLRGPYLAMVQEALERPRARERQLFEPAYVARLLEDPSAHLTPLRGSKLWQLGLLELWLQSHGL
jgi:asparagine synthase (glutamine-hydrolysing)